MIGLHACNKIITNGPSSVDTILIRILILTSRSSNITFLYSTPISHRKMESIDQGVCPIIDRNQMFMDTDA
jgi:hypothetical protein